MTIEITKPVAATIKAKDPAFSPALIVLGLDDGGKAHASAFGQAEVELATKAAVLMRMCTLAVDTDEVRALAGQLPQGRVFASGKAFVPFVRKPLYDRLSALAGPSAVAARPVPAAAMKANVTGRSDAKQSAPILPRDWSGIGVGSLVLVSEGGDDGWYEAEVLEDKGDDLFVLRWRDWPELPPVIRRRERIGLLNPTVPPDAP